MRERLKKVRDMRMLDWILSAILLMILIAIVAPQQLPIVAYKIALISLSAVLGYWLDRSLFPYARPHMLMDRSYLMFAAAQLRRAIIIGACVLGAAMGL